MIKNLLVLLSLVLFSNASKANPICNPSPEPIKQKYASVPLATNEKAGLVQNNLYVNPAIIQHGDVLFFEGTGPFDTYFTLDINYSLASDVFAQIQTQYHDLKNRGEAHITILTPVEYTCIFGPNNIYGTKPVSMKKIKKTVLSYLRKRQIHFSVEALGSGQKNIFNARENKFKIAETFFLITPSEDLIQLRNEVKKLLKGSAKEAFQAEAFYPHITIGYTDMDLHESDGVRKNSEYSLDPRFNIIN